MTPDLQGQVAIVTGASRGIGRAIAARLHDDGAWVVSVSRSGTSLGRGERDTGIVSDIADEAGVLALFGQVQRDHGRLDILVNNAGVGVFGPTRTFATADLDRVLAVNVRGTFLCCREALRVMVPAKRGTIINIASIVGVKGYPCQAAYGASKHAVMGLTKSLAAEVKDDGVRVSAVLPGGVDTDMAGASRPDLDRASLLRPDDVAEAVMYLLSLPAHAAVDQLSLRRRGAEAF